MKIVGDQPWRGIGGETVHCWHGLATTLLFIVMVTSAARHVAIPELDIAANKYHPQQYVCARHISTSRILARKVASSGRYAPLCTGTCVAISRLAFLRVPAYLRFTRQRRSGNVTMEHIMGI